MSWVFDQVWLKVGDIVTMNVTQTFATMTGERVDVVVGSRLVFMGLMPRTDESVRIHALSSTEHCLEFLASGRILLLIVFGDEWGQTSLRRVLSIMRGLNGDQSQQGLHDRAHNV